MPDGEAVRVRALAAALDWAGTPIGPRAGWPPGLRAVVDTLLDAPVPMALVLGAEWVLVYNDAYARIIGGKHPEAFGRPAPVVLAENWTRPGHAEAVERVFATGEPFFEAETRLPVQRRGPGGPTEQVHFSRAYAAVRDDAGQIVGVLTVISETTDVARALAGVAELGARLSSALSVDDVVREALRHGVEVVGADHARVVLADGPALQMARRAGVELDDESVDRLPPVWSRIPGSTPLPSVHVTRTGRPVWLAEDELAPFTALLEEPSGASRALAVASVPLHTGSVQGALSLGWERTRLFSAADRAALTTVGTLVGQAVARARRFDEQRDHAETLQRSMLPADLPHLPGINIGARYAPSAPGTSAGGDFYDAFALDDGRLVLAIGDVIGHGVLAAAVMGQVRAALRVLALQQPDPVRVLAGLDPFVASVGPESFVTALVAVFDPDRQELTLASAGHPAPLLRRRVDDVGVGDFLSLSAGPPLGIPAERTAQTVRLQRGDGLLMFTDGLVEVPGQDLGEGLAALRRLVLDRIEISDPRRLCALVLESFGTGEDDIAVVAVALDDGQRRTAALDLPAESSAPSAARSWARTALTDWGLEGDAVDVALLCTNELVTNALLHARSASRVELDLDAQRLLVLVTDTGMTATPKAAGVEPTAVRGRGLALVEALTDAWGSERTSRGTTVWFEIARVGAPAHPV